MGEGERAEGELEMKHRTGEKRGGEREVRGVLHHFGVLGGEAEDSAQSSAGRFCAERGAESIESTIIKSLHYL